MSIVIVTDVFCDGEDCLLWESGCSGSKANASRARKEVKTKGWKRLKVQGGIKDLCPKCVRKLGLDNLKGT